jgi:predicted GH43/DUF377 family glycosyl hydrolase
MGDGVGFAGFFREAPGARDAARARRFETRDLVARAGVISPKRLYINDHPVGNPIAAFNPALAVRDGEALLYVRVILGYYKYVSAVAEVRVPLDDLETGDVNLNYYAGKLVAYPSTAYDFWGAEDPRVYQLGNSALYMTYTGRTRFYFEPRPGRQRTLPVTAVTRDGKTWAKIAVSVMPRPLRDHVVTDKNAFYVRLGNRLYLFHRLHMDDERFYLVASRVEPRALEEAEKASREQGHPVEVVSEDTTIMLHPAGFETKNGWAAPPIQLGGGKLLAFIHGVDRDLTAYRLYAALLEEDSNGLAVVAVTPTYIMEPRTLYEIYGDRSYTVFPCGAWRLDRRRILISYGAADYMAALGVINLDQLLAELDKGRIG